MRQSERHHQVVITERNETDGQMMSLIPNIKFVVMEKKKTIVNTSEKQKETNTGALFQLQSYFQIRQRYVIKALEHE